MSADGRKPRLGFDWPRFCFLMSKLYYLLVHDFCCNEVLKNVLCFRADSHFSLLKVQLNTRNEMK